MSRVCELCGKKTTSGQTIARRGKAKYLGGVGVKTTGVTKRKFKPNIQRVRAVIDGEVRRLKICAACIRSGRLVKPTRTYVPKADHDTAPPVQIADPAAKAGPAAEPAAEA
jgi:large subunit ribosomal protein L28